MACPVFKIAGLASAELSALIEGTLLPILRSGGVIGVPTDTIYGLACLAQRTDAVHTLYRIKGRDDAKPVAICVGAIDHIPIYANVTVPRTTLTSLLPGPVTLLFPRTPALNPQLNPSTNVIGVRIPDHAFTQRLCELAGEAIALTSANLSGEPSTLRVEEFSGLWGTLGAVVDAGPLSPSRAGSTVVDLSTPAHYRIVRDGSALESTVATLHRCGLSHAL